MKMKTIFAALVALVALAGCSSYSVKSDWDEEARFDHFGTFAQFQKPDRRQGEDRRPRLSPIVEKRIWRSTVDVLQEKGFLEVSPGRADFVVTFHTAFRDRVYVSHYGGWGYPRRWRWGGWGHTRVHHYKEGSLVVDVFDRRDRELVWRGVAQGAFSEPNPSQEKVQKVVARVLRDFPPPGS
jgi:hypothetical protein